MTQRRAPVTGEAWEEAPSSVRGDCANHHRKEGGRREGGKEGEEGGREGGRSCVKPEGADASG